MVVMRVRVRALANVAPLRACYAILVSGSRKPKGGGTLPRFRRGRVLVRHLIACRIYDGADAAS